MIEALFLNSVSGGRVAMIKCTREEETELKKKLKSIGIHCLSRSASSRL